MARKEDEESGWRLAKHEDDDDELCKRNHGIILGEMAIIIARHVRVRLMNTWGPSNLVGLLPVVVVRLTGHR